MDEIYALLQRVDPNVDFKECDDFVDGGLLDSLSIVELVEMIESEYGIEIDGVDIDPDNFTSASDIYEMVMKYK